MKNNIFVEIKSKLHKQFKMNVNRLIDASPTKLKTKALQNEHLEYTFREC